ncbi:ABC transporter ATP-binding protein [Streptomyces sp. WZ-12]|uniref:ABC transporter ATP-binding protein n=1 Tax=Streptomyces sp. WZ-12 TaxID=3030210 RepID=UPI00238170EC|nr:ABC transporter ATP-binding protein [Streptomyces sp. WZ-12]
MSIRVVETPAPVLSAEGIARHFLSAEGEVVSALDGVSLTVEDGEFVCVVGPSGCGKSTLLRMLGGLDLPSAGTVRRRPGEFGGPAAAFVFQDFGVLPWLTVRANAGFGLRMAGLRRREADAVADRWLARVGLLGFARGYPDRLSGGMRQRLSLARAFASGSPLLLMDEPFGALDPLTRSEMQEQLLELWEQEGKTVVMVTHSIEEALLLGDRVVVMSDRPGSVIDVVAVPFARPRGVGLQDTSEFIGLRARVREMLRKHPCSGGKESGAGEGGGAGRAGR